MVNMNNFSSNTFLSTSYFLRIMLSAKVDQAIWHMEQLLNSERRDFLSHVYNIMQSQSCIVLLAFIQIVFVQILNL
jgi:hypothetical protein